MKKIFPFFLLFVALGLTGCDLIEGIFKAGMWFGLIIIMIILLIVGVIVRRFRK